MKEAKVEPIIKLTKHQLEQARGHQAREDSLERQLAGLAHRKVNFWSNLEKAYGLGPGNYYFDLETGEVFESWPKAE